MIKRNMRSTSTILVFFQISLAVLVTGIKGTSDSDLLSTLQDEYGKWRERLSPEYSTSLGIYMYNDKLESYDWRDFLKTKTEADRYLSSLASMDVSSLSEVNKVDYDIFKDALETFTTGYAWSNYSALNPINFLEGPQIDLDRFPDTTPFDTRGDFENYLVRLKNIPEQLNQMKERLKLAVAFKHTNHNASMAAVSKQITNIITNNPKQFPFYKPFKETLDNMTSVDSTTKERMRQEAEESIRQIITSYQDLNNYITSSYMKHLRQGYGVNDWDDGVNFYRACLRWHLSLDLTPEEVHEKGLQEVKRISNLMKKIMLKKNHNGTVKEFFDKMKRNSSFFYKTGDEVLNKFKDIIYNKIQPKLPTLFKNLPNLPVVVEPNPNDGTGGQYLQGPPDGSRPGVFQVNLFRPNEMIRIDFMALALHETNPGHHLQISTAATASIPRYRRYIDGYFFNIPAAAPTYTAYVEGWALYAESLGEEMGLYEDDYDLLGRYGSEIFRACRLVVDTGLHHFNWTREYAINYMLNYTAYGEGEMTNEIDRYMTWPGQACGYKIGELKIKELRAKATKELGSAFNIKDFHYTVLKNGAMPLNVLDKVVNKWINDVKRSRKEPSVPPKCDTNASERFNYSVSYILSLLMLNIIYFTH